MATEKVLMPQLGESVTEGTISKWLVSAGDSVKKYDPIAEVMTDKVNAEVPSSFTGTIKELVAEEGETLEVGELVAYIEVEGAGTTETDDRKEEHKQEEHAETKAADAEEQPMKKRYSPAVLRLAQENNIDLGQVNGSGRGGRITRKDIQQLLDSGEVPKSKGESEPTKPKQMKEAGQQAQPQAQPESAVVSAQGDVEIPVSGVRKAIAANMVKSKHEAPHAWLTVEVDVTDMVKYRNAMKNDFKQKEGYSLTFLPFFIKATVEALKEYPLMNSMWAGDKIVQKKDINISVAVATDDALFVPVIKHADEKNIKGIARNVNELANKVRGNQLTSADMEGGTFTVNNTGSFGSVMSTPIINHPQAAILSIESIVKRPVVINDMIAVRDMVNLCLSLDHRVLDGLICGKFLASVKNKLENMNKDNTSIY